MRALQALNANVDQVSLSDELPPMMSEYDWIKRAMIQGYGLTSLAS
jgi:hypothetical protein